MKLFQKLLLIFIVNSLVSCSSSEKDFLGEYSTYYISHVKVGNGMMSAGTRVMTINSAMDIYLLDKISVNIFINESTKLLSGTGNVVCSFAENSITCRLVRKEFDFELSDYQVKGDSLFFKMKSRIFNKKIDAYLLKRGDSTFIGIDKLLGGKNSYTPKNPFYNTENGNFNQYVANMIDSELKFKTFYEKQMETNKLKINSADTKDYEKRMYTITDEYIFKNYLK
jgi:hypothetical protein